MNDQLWAFCDPRALVQMKKNLTIVTYFIKVLEFLNYSSLNHFNMSSGGNTPLLGYFQDSAAFLYLVFRLCHLSVPPPTPPKLQRIMFKFLFSKP